MMKKLLSLVVAALLTVSAVATSASAAKFTDVDATNDALNDAVELLVALNVTTGTTETTYGTTENVTRAQMATFIYRMMKAGKHAPTGGANTTKFTDLDDPFYNFTIAWANETGVIKGRSETSFDPKGGIILQDAYTMIVRALGYDDGTLSYPIGYISKAEELGLDEDVDAKVNYDTTLTRGDVAIILANMFYAETAEAHIQYVQEGTITRPQEFHYTLAEEVFGVKKIAQKVVATPNYSFEGNPQPEADVEMIHLRGADFVVDYTADYGSINDIGVREFADLGLEGKADDYFLSDILMFVKLDKDGDVEEIFGAVSQGTKKTVSFDDIEFGAVKGTEDTDYYDGSNQKYKRFNGLLTIDGVKTYLANAPYTYAKDSGAANKLNAQFIELGAYDASVEDGEKYIDFVLANENLANSTTDTVTAENVEAMVVTNLDNNNDEVYGYLAPIYFGGLGEVDCYDCNGDGKYDYLFVKEYAVGIIDTEEEAYLSKDQNHAFDLEEADFAARTIYTDWSIVEGEKFEDEDVVLAYVDSAANYVKVIEVLKATKAEVTVKTDEYVELSDGSKVYYNPLATLADAPKAFATKTAGDDLGLLSNIDFEEYDFYMTADGAVAVIDGDPSTSFPTNGDWVVVLDSKTKTAASVVDETYTSAEYIKVYHDGVIKSVKAKFIESGKPQCDTDTPATNKDSDGHYDFSSYVNELATAKVDAKGNYYFDLAITEESANANALAGEDEGGQYKKFLSEAKLLQSNGYIYTLTDNASTPAPIIGGLNGVYVRPYTQIIIRSEDEEGEEIVTLYDYENLPDINENIVFEDVTVVLGNNVNSTKFEYLVAFYGYYDGELTGATGEVEEIRFVLGNTTKKDPDTGANVHFYKLFNPFTGEITSDVEAVDNRNVIGKASIVGLTTENYVDDTTGAIGAADDEATEKFYNASEAIKTSGYGYAEVAEFDKDSGYLLLAGEDEIFVVGEKTVITFYDISDGAPKTVTADALANKAGTYREGGDKEAALRVFVCAEEGEDFEENKNEIYDATFITIVRS